MSIHNRNKRKKLRRKIKLKIECNDKTVAIFNSVIIKAFSRSMNISENKAKYLLFGGL
ncbi:hypothetical protein phiPLPE_23 [Iodobacter phage PhiPLPE]|uniref:Uncharacterized protein n=1 Tax=Iodobacter phage PhiPLPE TaxID=551895 RepID=B5AX42_9CAUD|nr:hypothetical protein phiPLPE_23 [Iodobacter phage PhiPLPE]ACG60345.1 hypothetical protein phiPLPE_23 [Iodobacter phage PhiPLPE]